MSIKCSWCRVKDAVDTEGAEINMCEDCRKINDMIMSTPSVEDKEYKSITTEDESENYRKKEGVTKCVCCSSELNDSERTGITIMAKYIGYEDGKCMGYNQVSTMCDLRPLCKVCLDNTYSEIHAKLNEKRNIFQRG